jgi:coenzyme F420-0:L-glutamate ligase
LIPSAGIDLSNTPHGTAILWPRKPFEVAEELRKNLRKKFGLRNLGIIISDSHCTPLRWGVTGIAIGFAGFLGIQDERGRSDLFGNKLKVTKKAVCDNLASAALLIMGEAAERVPFAVIRGAPTKFTSRQQKKTEICVRPKDCIFGGIYSEKFKRNFR